MKVVILAGGFGTRLAEYTRDIPKPMVEVGGKPMLWHIMSLYAYYGFNEFIIALGYKKEVIKNYFLNFYDMNSDFTIHLSTQEKTIHDLHSKDWKVTLVDTGLHTMTGGRIKRLKSYIDPNEPFFLTYGDGLCDVNILKELSFHRKHGKLVTIMATHPPARFATFAVKNDRAIDFIEKSAQAAGWINGGYFIMSPKIIDYIHDDKTVLEQLPLQTLAEEGELMAYQHEGFWHCVDNIGDLNKLEELYQTTAPWIVWNKSGI